MYCVQLVLAWVVSFISVVELSTATECRASAYILITHTNKHQQTTPRTMLQISCSRDQDIASVFLYFSAFVFIVENRYWMAAQGCLFYKVERTC